MSDTDGERMFPLAEAAAAWHADEGTAESEALVAGDPDRATAVIRIAELLDRLYSAPLPQLWMTIANRNPRLGGTAEIPVRPVDHALATEGGLGDVVRLLEAYTQGK